MVGLSEILFTKEYPDGIDRAELEAIEIALIDAEDMARQEAEEKKKSELDAINRARETEIAAQDERARIKAEEAVKTNIWLPTRYRKLMPQLRLATRAAKATPACHQVLHATFKYQVSTASDPVFSVICLGDNEKSFSLFYGGSGEIVKDPNL